MSDRKVIFEEKVFEKTRHSNHWLKISGRPHLSIQSAKNVTKFFAVDIETKTFTENESLRIILSGSDSVYFSEFDKDFENVYLVKNGNTLEQRTVSPDDEVVLSLSLDQKVSDSQNKQVSVSDDGHWCAIGAGFDNAYWYLIDIPNKKQHKLRSKELKWSYTPSFVGNGSDQIVICGDKKCEIWDVQSRESLRVIELFSTGESRARYATCSVNDLLAIACADKVLRLYDVNSWEMIHSEKYELEPMSLHLTSDLKYLTLAGNRGEKCVVLRITY